MKAIFDGAFDRHAIVYNILIAWVLAVLNSIQHACDIAEGTMLFSLVTIGGYYIHKSIWITWGTFRANGSSVCSTVDSITRSALENVAAYGVRAVDDARKNGR